MYWLGVVLGTSHMIAEALSVIFDVNRLQQWTNLQSQPPLQPHLYQLLVQCHQLTKVFGRKRRRASSPCAW